MALTIVTEPTVEPLDVEEVENHLRLSDTSTGEEDVVIASYIKAARRYCERIQNRAYLHQTWDLIIDTWPEKDYIEIPRPPLVSVTHVKYYDTDETEYTMSAGLYYVDTNGEPGRVHLQYGETWPTTTLRPANGVAVRFVAGYGSVATLVPAEITQAMKLLVGHMYERREATDIKEVLEITPGAMELLWLDRVVPL